MKLPIHPSPRILLRLRTLARSLWRRLRLQQATSAHEEVVSGALIGWAACIVFSWGWPPLLMAASALCGLCVGAVIGLILWSGSQETPEEQIVPPARGEKRSDRSKSD